MARSGSAPPLLYVCEQVRIQALTLLGEPRIIIAVPGALNLCGICSDGVRVFCTDMDAHKIHVLRLTHSERWREKRREAMEEGRARRKLQGDDDAATEDGEACSGGGGGREGRGSSAAAASKERAAKVLEERSEKERKRDRAVHAVLTGRSIWQCLGLPVNAKEAELHHGVRMAMRLLHPDLAINHALKECRPKEYARVEAAFKKANNLKDMRVDQWLHGTPL